jgi:4-hydroxy-tetrahydrodipicolinate reductase
MTRIVVVGAAGRMGRALIRCIRTGAVPEVSLAGAVDLWDCPEIRTDAGVMAGAGEAGVQVTSDLAAVAPGADAIVDFSSHHGTSGNAPRCAEWGKPLVIGTTGLDAAQESAVRAAAGRIPVVMAPNMSLGINLLFALLEQAGRTLKDKGYDVEIVERHHRLKKDAPSGTALGLGRAVAKGMDWNLDDVAVHGRQGVAKDIRPDRQIGFHAVRGGDFVGDHTVIFATTGESVEFSHRATSRDTFAIGALQAAKWVVGRAPGLYSMRDVLGV